MDFEVLIIGTDANAYYMARCFHELYHKPAHLVGKAPLSYTEYSDILRIRYFPDLWEEIGFLNAVFLCKKELGDKKTLLISSNETYAGFIAKNREKLLAENFVFNYPHADIIDTFMYKEKFYKTYENSCLSLPKTVYYDCTQAADVPDDFTFPVILKPSNVIKYNHLDFEGKNKIYKIEAQAELEVTVRRIIAGGYDDCLIIQDFIPGDDSYLFDAVAYSDSTGKVRMVSFAQIGLQEHTRTMVGNAAVLINGYNQFGGTREITESITAFLEQTGYRGFAEFDLKFDRRDGKFKVLEINARQGRCSYYICPLGCNPVKLLIDDLIFNERPDYGLLEKEMLLSFVPKSIAKKYIVNEEYRKKALEVWEKQGTVDPLYYPADKNFKRKLYLLKRKLRYFRDYKNGYWKVEK